MYISHVMHHEPEKDQRVDPPRHYLREFLEKYLLWIFFPPIVMFQKRTFDFIERQKKTTEHIFGDFKEWLDVNACCLLWLLNTFSEGTSRADLNMITLKRITDPEKLDRFNKLWFGPEGSKEFLELQGDENLASLRIYFSDQDLMRYLYRLMLWREPGLACYEVLVKDEMTNAGIAEARFWQGFHSGIDFRLTLREFQPVLEARLALDNGH